ncbi:uncharacterized protein AB675_3742 [Cyphellophora attinorum]|uniref:Uncharacterized protein n=1 Tax=Cyphellophora attinorum TaxID=1664694 RepID=A0A0N1GXR9_9EURO|nr:uncharacterized protein AB675_3742 [Phialophora attinorum]KPI35250.1 hypothetical protein AB675_3742 [Phialophora attinorum]
MATNTIPPVRGLEVYGGYTGYKQKSDAASVAEPTFSNLSAEDTGRKVWCETIWANLSKQAIDHDLPRIQYFDTKTMLLSKEVNKKLWSQVNRLYKSLGPDRAVYATPKMLDGGEVKWYSFEGMSRGEEGTSDNRR